MKILVYTVSDFKPYADKCINMLFENIEKQELDLCVISNGEAPSDFKYKTIIDSTNYNYIGFLKYSKVIPSGYDAYVYLDSDIIYFGEIEDLISKDKEISVVFEKLKMNEDWFRYQHADNEKEISFFKKNNGLNAGSFCCKNISFLNLVNSLYSPFISGDVHLDARLEQSSFNYAVCKTTDFNLSKCFDITDVTQLFASDFPYSKHKKLYHFCGFSNEMYSKFLKMQRFLYEKQRANH